MVNAVWEADFLFEEERPVWKPLSEKSLLMLQLAIDSHILSSMRFFLRDRSVAQDRPSRNRFGNSFWLAGTLN